MKSEFLKHVGALASYAQKELGLKPGDVYTIFMPTTVSCFVAFMPLTR